MSFKDLIETKAERHNIVFMPVVGKGHDGKQLYTFGRIDVYTDRGVVLVQGETTWVPTSLQSLIDTANQRRQAAAGWTLGILENIGVCVLCFSLGCHGCNFITFVDFFQKTTCRCY